MALTGGRILARVRRSLLLVTSMLAMFATADAGTIDGRIRVLAKNGTTKPDASGVVVYVADMKAPDKGAKAEIRQRGKEFVPRITAVSAGTTITFPNDDPEEHNVFSHSKIAEFDLGRYARDRGKSKAFLRVGVAEIFCNVHPDMVSYVVVAPSSAKAVTGSDGTFRIDGVPPGKHTLTIWNRFASPRERSVEIDVRDGVPTAFVEDVAEAVDAEAPHKNKHGVAYTTGYR